MILLMSGLALAADCPEPATDGQVASELQAALLSFAVMDDEAFVAAADRAFGLVDCLGERATPQLAASLHRVHGVRALYDGDAEAARASLAAALGIEPDHALSATLAPEGGKLAVLYTEAAGVDVGRVPHGLDGYEVVVDGRASDTVPEGPYLVQVGGEVPSFTAWLAGGMPSLPDGLEPTAAPAVGTPPAVPTTPAAVAASTPRASTSSTAEVTREKKGKGLLWAGVASGAVAAGLYGTAVAGRVSYDASPSTSTASLTNGAFFGSIGTAALSAGLLTAHVATR
jgi:hypothetical protein